jgi:hypothetical protein
MDFLVIIIYRIEKAAAFCHLQNKGFVVRAMHQIASNFRLKLRLSPLTDDHNTGLY